MVFLKETGTCFVPMDTYGNRNKHRKNMFVSPRETKGFSRSFCYDRMIGDVVFLLFKSRLAVLRSFGVQVLLGLDVFQCI